MIVYAGLVLVSLLGLGLGTAIVFTIKKLGDTHWPASNSNHIVKYLWYLTLILSSFPVYTNCIWGQYDPKIDRVIVNII